MIWGETPLFSETLIYSKPPAVELVTALMIAMYQNPNRQPSDGNGMGIMALLDLNERNAQPHNTVDGRNPAPPGMVKTL